MTIADRHLSPTVEVRKPTLSPTALGNAEVCGRRLQFYLDPDVSGTTGQGLARGQAWHWMMEQFNRLRLYYQAQGEPPPDDLDVEEWLMAMGWGYYTEQTKRPDYVAHDSDLAHELVQEQLAAMYKAWAATPAHAWLDPGTTIATVEAEVLTEMGSPHHQMRGFIDAIYHMETGDFDGYEGLGDHLTILVDYKTASRRWGSDTYTVVKNGKDEQLFGDLRKMPQASLYTEAWERSTGERVDWFVYDIVTVTGVFQRIWCDVRPEKREPFIDHWREVSEMIHLHQTAGIDMPTNPGHYLCSEKWCSYWDLCPMGAGLHSEKARAK